jgi:hypothetical protein
MIAVLAIIRAICLQPGVQKMQHNVSKSNTNRMLTRSIVNTVLINPILGHFQLSFRTKELGRTNYHIIIIYKNTGLEYTKKFSINKYWTFAV